MSNLSMACGTCLLSIALFSCTQQSSDPLTNASTLFTAEADSLGQSLAKLKIQASKSALEVSTLQATFKEARKHYKRIEGIVEFHFPGVADAFNGPALPEVEEYDDKLVDPTGFQVVEEFLFPTIDPDPATLAKLDKEVSLMVSMMARLKGLLETNVWTAENIFEASRLELFRIMSLGITGFDSPVGLLSIQEAKIALEGLRHTVLCFGSIPTEKEILGILMSDFSAAEKYLDRNPDFEKFNRAEFIVDFLGPISKSMYNFQQSCGIPNNKWLTAVDMNYTNFASVKAIRPEWFAPTHTRGQPHAEEIVRLGQILFFDPILSGNNARSCASCHQPEKAFTDGRIKSVAFNALGNIDRNAPTVINSGFQKSQFADSRIHFLEDQVADVVSNDREMHGQIGQAATKIQQSKEYQKLFARAFGDSSQQSVTKERVQAAIARYLRFLNGLDSRVDKYFEGDKVALSTEEVAGLNLFMGKAKCATCHFAPLFNGSVPPMYNDTEAEIIGTPARPDTLNAMIDVDPGKFRIFGRALHKFAFKTPTVRNASLTAPYMHNGVYKTLEEVIDFYNRGGGAGIGIELPNQTLPPDPLQLDEVEKRQLIAFIKALTDTVNLTSMPAKLPAFSDEDLNRRKIGGVY